MKLSLLPLLACPDCGSDIELAQGETVVDDDVVGGILECVGCRRSFVIERRFPLLLPKGFGPLQQDQMEIWDSNVDHYDADFALVAFGMVEIPYTIHALDLEPDYNLLDAGCGTGRMTVQLASKVKELVCVDYSTKSLTEAEKLVNAASVRNVHFIQGDICHLPLKSMLFSRILCARVLEYLPTEDHQKEAVAELNRCVLPGSTITISASRCV